MSDDSESKPVIEMIPGLLGEVSAVASAQAPFLYFDGASNFGINHGVVNITLEAVRHFSAGGAAVHDRVMVAHLRTSAAGLFSLKKAIEGIELLAAPAPDGPKN